ncbi:MAG TPA: hypothetical protein PKI20_13580 [Verrucomicrobiota bacterium]|jgi:hypothetical protein|nr:hypothetical protein [Verrucomicrobiota bacterium]HQL78696.1 hypothetical protein [Verrucomicrobiota bacterium]
MNKKKLLQVKDGSRTLYYSPLPRPRKDGVVATLVGYRKAGRTHWY